MSVQASRPGTPRRYAYIDTLRGCAILMVIAVHTSQYFTDLPSGLRLLADQGARGVQLFFVASALTLCLSWEARATGAGPFYVRRLFRIAPAFWLAIAYFVWRNGLGPNYYAPDGMGARHVVLTALFLHGFLPDTINSLVPGGWSVADEMTFYAVFPLLMLFWKRLDLLGAALFAIGAMMFFGKVNTIAASYGLRLPRQEQALWFNFLWLWFPTQVPCFMFGMLIAKTTDRPVSQRIAKLLLFASFAAMVAIPFCQSMAYYPRLDLQTSYGLAFAALTLSLISYQPRWLVNPVLGWIGKISFSGYLIHLALIPLLPKLTPFQDPPLDFAVMMAVVTTATVAISSLTYVLIEKPMIRLGELVIANAGQGTRAEEALAPNTPVAVDLAAPPS